MIIVGIVVVLLVAGIIFMSSLVPDIKKFEYLNSPQISSKADKKMIVVEVTGDPSTAGKKEIGVLFKMFFTLKGKNKDMKMVSLRARWPKPVETPREQWLGIWAMPISENVTELPDIKSDVAIKIDTWKYGEVAEILHLGPYSEEAVTIEKLINHIKSSGYVTSGPHEEEYLKGPGMPFIKPKDYATIIRYQVKKVKGK